MVGIERQGTLKKAARLRQVFVGQPLVGVRHPLEIQVRCIGMQQTLCSPCFGSNEFGIERVGEPRYDFVLHVKKVGNRFIETLGPEVIASFSVN